MKLELSSESTDKLLDDLATIRRWLADPGYDIYKWIHHHPPRSRYGVLGIADAIAEEVIILIELRKRGIECFTGTTIQSTASKS